MSDSYSPTERTRLRRLPKRAEYDRARIDAILDEALVCHVGFVDDGQPYVLPTNYARWNNHVYIHGSAAGRMLRALASGGQLCLTVTLVDGLVLARSAFHHSMNYRSVVVLGQGRLVSEPDEKLEALRRITNHIVPGRWDEVRPPNEQELKATHVVAMPLNEVSAKVRVGPPIDDEEDYALPVWAGWVPLETRPGKPVADERLHPAAPPLDLGRFARYAKSGG